jgi:hypothetical protein
MAVVLQLWIEVSLDQLFKVRVEYPLLLLAALAVDNREELIEFGAVLEVVLSALNSFLLVREVVLVDEVVTHFSDRQQTLQTSIQIAVEGVIVQTNNAVFEFGHLFECTCWLFRLLGRLIVV